MRTFEEIKPEHREAAIQAAKERGFTSPSTEPEPERQYYDAMDYLWANPQNVEIVEAELTRFGKEHHLSADLPCGHHWVQGEIYFNPKTEQYEDTVQDDDGKIYTLTAKR